MTDKTLNSVCGYCSTGCRLVVDLVDGRPLKVYADPAYPVNRGKACPKGFQFLGHLDAPERARSPYLRDSQGSLRTVGWDTALSVFCDRFKDIQARHGRESVAFLSTGQLTNEEFAFFGALAKFGMGMVHGDGNTRQCMASAVVAHKQSFGFDAPPFAYEDLEESDLLMFFGSNPAIAHPILWQRVKRNQRQPRIIVVDPRRSETASAAGVEHVALRPKTDLVLLYGLAGLLISRGWIDQGLIERHTSGYEEFRAFVGSFPPALVRAQTGVSEERLESLAEAIHKAQRTSFWWMVGINQGHQAVRTAQAIIDLALLTGNIGRPGTGANSITGQCNAMGTRLFGSTRDLMCGRDFSNPVHRAEIADLLGIDESTIPRASGLFYDEIIEAVDKGVIKGLWIVCTNPAHSWPDRHHLERVLRKAEFVVVQDMFSDTDTARFAHLILPAAGCGEKDGTFINSERRFGLLRRILPPPGEALSDFEIFQRVADRWGCGEMFRAWTSPEAVFEILRRASAGTPCDFTGITGYGMLDGESVQWPYPAGTSGDASTPASTRARRLFEDGRFFHPDGRARFVFEPIADLPETPSAEYPFVLLTGRGSVTQWHTLTRSDRAPALKRASPDPAYVLINPEDAGGLGVQAGDPVQVKSPRGSAEVRAEISDTVQPGQLFMPMHFIETNNLTRASFDPYSHQPSFKYGVASVRKAGSGGAERSGFRTTAGG